MYSRGERKNVVCRQISQPSSSSSPLPWPPFPSHHWPLVLHDLSFRRRCLRLALAVLPTPFSRVHVRWVRIWWIPVGSSSEVFSTVIFVLLRLPSKFLWVQLLFLFYKVLNWLSDAIFAAGLIATMICHSVRQVRYCLRWCEVCVVCCSPFSSSSFLSHFCSLITKVVRFEDTVRMI